MKVLNCEEEKNEKIQNCNFFEIANENVTFKNCEIQNFKIVK